MAGKVHATGALVLLAACLVWGGTSGNLTTAEERGRQIYEKGASPSGKPILARIQSGGDGLPAGLLPCGGCHGPDGSGRPEGGITPSNITWNALTRPYSVVEAGERQRPPYDEKLFKRAVTMGLDSAGNTLDAAMPRFRMTLADADDLVAYIHRLGDSSDPGVTDGSIRIGVVLAPSDRPAWNQVFDRINGDGGIYGRRIESVFMDSSKLAGGLFMLAIAGAAAHEGPIPSLVISEESGEHPRGRNLFYLDAGPGAEVDALCLWIIARDYRRPGSVALIADDSAASRRLAERARERLAGAGLPPPIEHAPGDMAATSRREVAVFLWLSQTTSPVKSFKGTEVLIPGSIMSASPPEGTEPLDFHLIVASSVDGQVRPLTSGARIATAAAVIAGVLRGAGRDLSRSGAVTAFENLRNFETGILGPLSYSPSRHDGTDTPTLFIARPAAGSWQFEKAPR